MIEAQVDLSGERLEDSIDITKLRYKPIIDNAMKRHNENFRLSSAQNLEGIIINSIAYGEIFLTEFNKSLDGRKDGYHSRVIASYIVSNNIKESLNEDSEGNTKSSPKNTSSKELLYSIKPNMYHFLKDSEELKTEEGMEFLVDDFVNFLRTEDTNYNGDFYLKTKDYFLFLNTITEDKIKGFDEEFIMIAKDAIKNANISEISFGLFDCVDSYKNDSFENIYGNEKVIDSIKKICNSLLYYFPSIQKNPYPVPSSIIFSGEPGTGKTMAARAMVNYIFDYAKLFKKKFTVRFVDQTIKDRFYGESEKVLKEAFEAVKSQGGIGLLIVDEADTVFPPINYSDKPLETSLMGLLLNELDGIKRSQRNNFTSVFITNRPYNGIMDALHSRSKEFVFEKYKDQRFYEMQIKGYLQNFGIGDCEALSLEELSATCLDFSLSGRDLKNVLDTLFYEKTIVGIDNLYQKKNFYEIRKDAIKDISKISTKDFLDVIKEFYVDKEKLKNNEISERVKYISESIICQEMGYKLASQELSNSKEE